MKLDTNQTIFLIQEHIKQINEKLESAKDFMENEEWKNAEVELQFVASLQKLAKSRLSTLM